MNEQINTALRELLLGQFNEEELTRLCADLGMNYASLPGEGAFGKTRAMLMTTQNNNKLFTLIAKVRDLRPEAYAESQLPELLANNPSAAPSETAAPAAAPRAEASPATAPATKRDLKKIITLIAAIGLALLVCMLLGDGLLGLINGATANPGGVSGGLPTLAPVTPAPLATAAPTLPPLTPGLPTAMTNTPAPTSAPVPAAAQRVIDLNQQLIAYYQGQTNADALTEYWTTEGVKEPVAFKETTLPRVMQTGKPVAAGAISALVKYLQGPQVASEDANGAVVNTREYWKYTNTASGQTGCETRDYAYTFVMESGKLKVHDVAGKQVSAGCTE